MGLLFKLVIAVVMSFVLVFTSINALADERCYYDPNGVNYNYFLKHTKFSRAEWDDTKKEAKVALENGDEVVIGYAACYEFGLNAKYKIASSMGKLNSKYLIKKILWLGRQVLNESDYDLLVAGVKDEQFINDLNDLQKKERVFVGVGGSDHQSFLVYAVFDRTNFYIEISWND